MKKRKTLLFACLIAISLTGCKKEVERKTEDVKGTVIDVNYQAAYTTVVPHYNAATKTTMLHTQHHPADYDTYIDYNGYTYELDSKEAYTTCKNKVGKEVDCEYTTIYYDNDTTKSFLSVGGHR